MLNNSTSISRQISPASVFVYGILFVALSFLRTGYTVCGANQGIHIPLVFCLNDPSLYPSDPFAATLRYYASPLWQVVAWFAATVPLESLLFWLFVLERFLVIGASAFLAHSFTPKSRLAMVGSMALFAFAIRPIVGMGTLTSPYFEQTGFSIVFFLLAVAAFYRHRPFWWAACLGIEFNLNSMYGTYAVTYFLMAFLISGEYRRSWKKWMAACLFFLFLAAPALWMTLRAFGRPSSGDQEWITALEFYYPYHFYPSTWGRRDWGVLGLLFALTTLVLFNCRKKEAKLWRFNMVWLGVCLIWIFYAFISVYVARSPAMIIMHPARATDLWYCLAGISLLSAAAARLEEDPAPVWAAIFGASVWTWELFQGSYVIVPALISIAVAFNHRWAWEFLLAKGSPKRIAFLLCVWVLTASSLSFYGRYRESGTVEQALCQKPPAPITEAAQWAGAHTSRDTVFLIDPTWELFRIFSRRPVFLLWKDGSAILWDKPFAGEWLTRFHAIGIDTARTRPIRTLAEIKSQVRKGFSRLTDKDVKELAGKYPVNYWVVPVNKISGFTEVFRGSEFKVLKVNPPGKGQEP